jgi:hypothetical protein
MKKLGFLLALGVVLVSSCKKQYTCTCKYIGTVAGTGAGTYVTYIPNATQAEAAAICASQQVYTPVTQGGAGKQTVSCSL